MCVYAKMDVGPMGAGNGETGKRGNGIDREQHDLRYHGDTLDSGCDSTPEQQ